MEGMCKVLCLRVQVQCPWRQQGWLGLPAFSKGGWPTSQSSHLVHAPFEWTSSGGKCSGAWHQDSLDVCWAPSEQEAAWQPVCQT